VMSEATVTILIPTPLRRFTGGAAKVPVTGATVGEALASLDAIHPGISEKVLGDDGEIRRFVNVFVNGTNVRDGAGVATVLKAGDEIGVIPAMAGGGIA